MAPAKRKTDARDSKSEDEETPETVEAADDAGEAAGEETVTTYTIDELAAKTNVPSRTIRFYQAKQILDRPKRKGRVAAYTDEHADRLELIAKLQDRGLRIRGMKQLLGRPDADEAVKQWLGLSDKLSTPWTDDRARVMDESEMTALIGERPSGTLAAVLRAGLAERREDAPHTFLVSSPGLLDVALRLVDSGLSVDVLEQLQPILRDGLRDSAEGVVDYFVERGGLEEAGGEEDLTKALDALRTFGTQAVSIIFAQEIERTLNGLLEEGQPRKRRGRRRRSKKGRS